MKKHMLSALAASFFSFQVMTLVADAATFVSIDSLQLMGRSKEGKAIDAKIQKAAAAFNEFYQNGSQEIAKLQDEFNAKANLLSQEALQEKAQQLAQKKKVFERDLADKKEALEMLAKNERSALYNKQSATVYKMCSENKWSGWFEKNAPGVHLVAQDMDKTELVLARVDADYTATAVKTTASKVKKDSKAA